MSQFTVTIAGVECLILCHDAELLRFFREAYRPFLGDGNIPEFTFVFRRTHNKTGTVLRSWSTLHGRAELAIGDIQNASHVFVFNYLFKVAFARLYTAKQYGVLLHASSAARRGRAVVIAGDKGTGKSTSLQLLQRNGFVGLSDDVTLLKITGSSVRVYASPFHERHDFLKKNEHATAASVIVLHRTHGSNRMTQMSMVQRTNALYYHSYAWGFGQYVDAATMKTLRVLAYQIASLVPCFDVYLRAIDDSALQILSGQKPERDKITPPRSD